jgi:ABC-type sugar transport system permease subunit
VIPDLPTRALKVSRPLVTTTRSRATSSEAATMTGGGPGFTTDVIASAIYKQYQAGFYGLSTAGIVILFIAISFIAFPLMRYFNRKELEL